MKTIAYFRILSALIGLFAYQFSFAQKYANNWLSGNFGLVFGDNVTIRKDFVSADTRGAGIISNADGQLLFYTNGLEVRNKNHEIMPHGDSILLKPATTSIQESLIVPLPSSTSIYYIFTTDQWNGQATSGLYYSVVDMSLDNGKGDVTIKRVRLLENGSSKITAVYHQNQKDVWVLTHQHNTNLYYAFLVTASGLSKTPVVSQIGNSQSYNTEGQLKASPDGKKVACSYDYHGQGFGLFDFNNSTGELSNPMNFIMPASYRACYGLEFSPDARKLFVHQGGSTGESGLYQFNLTSSVFEDINKSRVLLHREIYNSFRKMQLAPDGKIYITKGGGGGGTDYLGVIDRTNELGKECIVKENGLYLEGQSSFVASTPNFIQNYFFRTSFEWDQTCQSQPVNFMITNTYRLDSVRWEFGEGSSSKILNPKVVFNQPGNYKISLIVHYPDKTETIVKTITINPFSVFDLGKDTLVCPGYDLRISEKFPKYNWSTGDTTQSVTVKEKGWYKLTVKNSYGCYSSDSILMDVAAVPVINLPETVQAGVLDFVLLNAGDFTSYSWSTGATTSSIYARNEGWYSVTVSNNAGCIAVGTVFLQRNTLPQNGENSDWVLLNPKPSLNSGSDIFFLSKNIGFIVTDKELLKTDDGGTTWKKVWNLTSGKRISFKNRIGYIIGNGGTIYKSTHDGIGWNKINTGFTDDLNAITVIHPDTIFVTGDRKVFASNDGGKTWEITTINGVDIEDSYFNNSKTGHVACKNGRILKTVDGGTTWYVTETSNIIPSNFFRITFVNDKIGYASQQHSEVYKTTDGGETWKEIASLDAAYCLYFFNKDTGYIAGEYGAIHKTTDGGKTWQWKGGNGRYSGASLYGICFTDEETGFAVGMNGRILKTKNDGNTWSEYASISGEIRKIQFPSVNKGYMLAGSDLYTTQNKGENWTRMGPVLNSFDYINDTIGYAISSGSTSGSWISNRVYKTTDGGKTWSKTNDVETSYYSNLNFIEFFDSQTGFVSTGSYGATYRTSNGGNSWELVSQSGLYQIQFLNPQIGYAAGNYNKFYKTIDGGKTWTLIFERGEFIRSFHFTDDLHGFITGDNSMLYRTVDGGSNWKKLEIPYEYYTAIRFISDNVGYLLDEEGKLYQTQDAGATWKSIHNLYGITQIDLTNQNIYIAGNYGRILRNTIRYDSVAVYLAPVKNAMSKRATLKGIVASNGSDVSEMEFQYAADMSFANLIKSMPDVVLGLKSDSVYANITGLKGNTEYYFRIKYRYNGKVYTSNYVSFRTPPDYYIDIYTVTANRCDEQQLAGQIISNADEISEIKFQYGKDTLFNFYEDANPSIVAGESSVGVNVNLTHLDPSTKYYCRLKARYNGKEIWSRISSFQTLPENNFNFYNASANGSEAKISVQISAYRDTLDSIFIEYGRTREYLQRVQTTPNQVLLSNVAYAEATLTGLQANSAYFYRIKAKQGNTTIYSKENILNLTEGVVIEPATTLQQSDSSILLQGLIHSGGKYIYGFKFEYGTTPQLGDSVIANLVSNYDPTRNIYFLLRGLFPATKYYFRIKATDGKIFYYSSIYSYTLGVKTGTSISRSPDYIEVYPNPATDYVVIDTPGEIEVVKIFDINGKLMNVKTEGRRLNLAGFKKGIYIIRIFTNNREINYKVIIQ